MWHPVVHRPVGGVQDCSLGCRRAWSSWTMLRSHSTQLIAPLSSTAYRATCCNDSSILHIYLKHVHYLIHNISSFHLTVSVTSCIARGRLEPTVPVNLCAVELIPWLAFSIPLLSAVQFLWNERGNMRGSWGIILSLMHYDEDWWFSERLSWNIHHLLRGNVHIILLTVTDGSSQMRTVNEALTVSGPKSSQTWFYASHKKHVISSIFTMITS